MAHFLYITEVFCPWCYGFSPVISKIKEEYALPFQVICGALIEEPTSLAKRLERTPNIEAFIDRMYAITNVRISDAYVNMLRSKNNTEIFLNSQKGGLLFYALKELYKKSIQNKSANGNLLEDSMRYDDKSLEIMKDLQDVLYNQGRDVLSLAVLEEMARKYALDFDKLQCFMQEESTQEKTYEETEYSFDIMEDVVLYPTLYYVTGSDKRYFISRGYVTYEKCIAIISEAIEASKKNMLPEDFLNRTDKKSIPAENTENQAPFSCSLDGKCE